MGFFAYPNQDGASGSERDAAFLGDATREQWDAIIARLGTEPFARQQVIFEVGAPGDAFFILVEGEVDVVVGLRFGERIIARIRSGSIFGEIAFLDEGVRTATVRAVTAGSMIRITRDAFLLLQAWEPALAQQMLHDLARICAQRLRRTVDRVRNGR